MIDPDFGKISSANIVQFKDLERYFTNHRKFLSKKISFSLDLMETIKVFYPYLRTQFVSSCTKSSLIWS